MAGRKKNRNPLLCLWQTRSARFVFAALLFGWPGIGLAEGGVFFTADQLGERLMGKGEFLEAAEIFEDPARRGVAYYRGGDFESAASVFGRLKSPEAAYNRGNALIFLGRYEEAIESYKTALQSRPDWVEAEQNLVIAQIRKDRLAPPDDDAGGTGGKMEADEIVFDDTGRVNKSGTEQTTEGGETLSDEQMRAVWLRRVQNDPQDFLRTRFAYQLYREEQEGAVTDDDEADDDD